MPETLNRKIVTATKWSAITEVLAKLVAPISSMVLARLLTPDAFGVVATLNMVIAFAEKGHNVFLRYAPDLIPSNIHCGHHVYIGPHALFMASIAHIYIGNYVTFGPNVTIRGRSSYRSYRKTYL